MKNLFVLVSIFLHVMESTSTSSSSSFINAEFLESLQQLKTHYQTYLQATTTPEEYALLSLSSSINTNNTTSTLTFQNKRPSYALTPVQINMQDPTRFFFWFDPTVPLDQDADILSIHDDFYGVPWNCLYNSSIQPPISCKE